jgi:hypothetical protein
MQLLGRRANDGPQLAFGIKEDIGPEGVSLLLSIYLTVEE